MLTLAMYLVLDETKDKYGGMSQGNGDARAQDPDLLEVNDGTKTRDEEAEAPDSDHEEDKEEELEENFDD